MALDGAEVDISDRDWFACDLAADERATRLVKGLESQAYGYNYNPNPFAGLLELAALAGNPGNSEYDDAMRRCLVKRGYAIKLPDSPFPTFDKPPAPSVLDPAPEHAAARDAAGAPYSGGARARRAAGRSHRAYAGAAGFHTRG